MDPHDFLHLRWIEWMALGGLLIHKRKEKSRKSFTSDWLIFLFFKLRCSVRLWVAGSCHSTDPGYFNKWSMQKLIFFFFRQQDICWHGFQMIETEPYPSLSSPLKFMFLKLPKFRLIITWCLFIIFYAKISIIFYAH